MQIPAISGYKTGAYDEYGDGYMTRRRWFSSRTMAVGSGCKRWAALVLRRSLVGNTYIHRSMQTYPHIKFRFVINSRACLASLCRESKLSSGDGASALAAGVGGAYSGVGGGSGGAATKASAGELARGRAVALAGTGFGGVGVRAGDLTRGIGIGVVGIPVLREGALGFFGADVPPFPVKRRGVDMFSSRLPAKPTSTDDIDWLEVGLS